MKIALTLLLSSWFFSIMGMTKEITLDSDPSILGYDKQVTNLGFTKEVLLKDQRNGGDLRIVYLPYLPFIESIQTTNAHGEIQREDHFAKGSVVQVRNGWKLSLSTFRNSHEFLVARERLNSSQSNRRTYIDQKIFDRTMRLADYQKDDHLEKLAVATEEEARACLRPEPPSGWQSLLSDLSWLSFSSDVESTQNHNTTIDPSCGGYNGGMDQAESELRESMQIGLACLNRVGGRAREEAARLLAIFQPEFGKTFRFICDNESNRSGYNTDGAYARAIPAVFDGGPAIIVSNAPDKPSLGRNRTNKALIFHELMHLLGYAHGMTEDFSELAAACCFSDPDDSARIQLDGIACQALRIADTRNPDYIRLYSRFNHRYGVIDRYAYGVAMLSMEEVNSELATQTQRTNPDLSLVTEMGLGMFEVPIEGRTYARDAEYGGGFGFGPYMGLAFARSTLEFNPAVQRDNRQERYNQLLNAYYPRIGNRDLRQSLDVVAELMSAAIKGDREDLEEVMDANRNFVNRFCQNTVQHPLDSQLARTKDGFKRILNSLGRQDRADMLNSYLCPSVSPKSMEWH
jgi:hypothetical protein